VAVTLRVLYSMEVQVFGCLMAGLPGLFLWGEDGIISGWNGGSVAIQAKDNSASANYKGLAIAADGTDSFIYAANFKTGRIDVYDTAWNKIFNKPFRDFLFLPAMHH